MKRTGKLYERIADLDNLYLAFWKAQKRKRGVPEVEEFRKNLENNIGVLQQNILSMNFVFGKYHTFTIYDPKERMICAASFKERVLHHAIINVCDDTFEKFQISDSYACRKGKGVHACLRQAQCYTGQYKWYLKFDVRKYFDSIDHNVLKQLLHRKFKDAELLGMFKKIIDTYEVNPSKGIPIGNLTSQYFANYYLSFLDHFIKEEMCVKGYVRYMDDFVLWHNDKDVLKKLKFEIEEYCLSVLRLVLKPCCLNQTKMGISMLGHRVFSDKFLLTKRSRNRFARKYSLYCKFLLQNKWDQMEFAEHVEPLISCINYSNSFGFRKHIINNLGYRP